MLWWDTIGEWALSVFGATLAFVFICFIAPAVNFPFSGIPICVVDLLEEMRNSEVRTSTRHPDRPKITNYWKSIWAMNDTGFGEEQWSRTLSRLDQLMMPQELETIISSILGSLGKTVDFPRCSRPLGTKLATFRNDCSSRCSVARSIVLWLIGVSFCSGLVFLLSFIVCWNVFSDRIILISIGISLFGSESGHRHGLYWEA